MVGKKVDANSELQKGVRMDDPDYLRPLTAPGSWWLGSNYAKVGQCIRC